MRSGRPSFSPCEWRQIVSSGFSSWTLTVKWPGSAGGDLTTSWLHYSPPLNPTVTFFSPVSCSNKHPEITLFLPMPTKILEFLSSSSLSVCFLCLLNSVGRHASTWFEPCLDPAKADPTTHIHTPKENPAWFCFGARIRLCVDSVFTGMWLCCCIFMIFPPNEDSHPKALNEVLKEEFCLHDFLKAELQDFFFFPPHSHRIKSNFLKSRERLYRMATHTEIYSHTSAGSQSQGSATLCTERQHNICLSTGLRKME